MPKKKKVGRPPGSGKKKTQKTVVRTKRRFTPPDLVAGKFVMTRREGVQVLCRVSGERTWCEVGVPNPNEVIVFHSKEDAREALLAVAVLEGEKVKSAKTVLQMHYTFSDAGLQHELEWTGNNATTYKQAFKKQQAVLAGECLAAYAASKAVEVNYEVHFKSLRTRLKAEQKECAALVKERQILLSAFSKRYSS